MSLVSLPITAREIKATERRLEAIYSAARMGLKGDALALSAGLLPVEFNRLAEFDPMVRVAEQKGRADAERELSEVLHNAARAGDAKAALEILKHQHNWTAAQRMEVSVEQRISITAALQAAERRVAEGLTIDMTPALTAPEHAETRL